MNYRIYWNLHKRCYSVQRKVGKNWKVVNHADELIADNVTFDVSAAGRERVRREGVKNVHAFLYAEHVAYTEPGDVTQFEADTSVTYNPYKHESFVTVDGERVEWAYAAHLTTNRLIHSHRKPIIHVEGPYIPTEEVIHIPVPLAS